MPGGDLHLETGGIHGRNTQAARLGKISVAEEILSRFSHTFRLGNMSVLRTMLCYQMTLNVKSLLMLISIEAM